MSHGRGVHVTRAGKQTKSSEFMRKCTVFNIRGAWSSERKALTGKVLGEMQNQIQRLFKHVRLYSFLMACFAY